jgi:hypothetical protein
MFVGLKHGAGVCSPHPLSSVRRALLAGVAGAFLIGAVSTALVNRAQAQSYMFGPAFRSDFRYDYRHDYYRPDYYYRPDVRPDLKPNPRPSLNTEPKPKPEPLKDFGVMPKGPLQIVVSISSQSVTLYSNGVRMAHGPVSTGVPGRPTPTGVFSIIQKDRFHHSNLYSNAPMPYMERITWSGVALHEGPLPGYPASHGCIRMTHDFAARLWGVARLGVRVIVARTDVVPADISHPHLFEPKAKPPDTPVAGNESERNAGSIDPVKVAQATTSTDTGLNRAGARTDSSVLRGAVEAEATTAVGAATSIASPPAAGGAPIKPAATEPSVADPPKPAPDAGDPGKATPLLPKTRADAQPGKHAGQVAVLISRKEQRLFVRQGMVPLFDMPVGIEHPEQPLGTHVFTAMGFTDGGAGMRWNVMSMPAEPQRPLIVPKIGPKGIPAAKPTDLFPPQTPAQVLDRIQIPEEAVNRIGELLIPGSSLVISDQGLGGETGEGTDFIVLTR